jgi:cytochrome c-type biogenesis protein CcmH
MDAGSLLLWLALAAMTAATLALLLHPLLRRRQAAPERAAHDLAVYRDQLDEIERDVERGVLDAVQAQAARVEVERRMLAAASHDASSAAPARPARGARVAAVLLALALPAGALALYLDRGAPGVPSVPFASRAPATRDAAVAEYTALASELAKKLAENPAQPEGWMLLGRAYADLGRFEESASAYAQAIAYGAQGAGVQADYGEALVAAADGRVEAKAAAAFAAALKADAAEPRARFFLALARAQVGQWDLALAQWLALEKDSPADAPWREVLAQRIEMAARQLGLDPATLPGRTPAPVE